MQSPQELVVVFGSQSWMSVHSAYIITGCRKNAEICSKFVLQRIDFSNKRINWKYAKVTSKPVLSLSRCYINYTEIWQEFSKQTNLFENKSSGKSITNAIINTNNYDAIVIVSTAI